MSPLISAGFVLNQQSLNNFLVEGIHWPSLSNSHSFYQYSSFYTQESALTLCNHSIGFHLIIRSSLSFCSLCKFEEAWHLMVSDSCTGSFSGRKWVVFCSFKRQGRRESCYMCEISFTYVEDGWGIDNVKKGIVRR